MQGQELCEGRIYSDTLYRLLSWSFVSKAPQNPVHFILPTVPPGALRTRRMLNCMAEHPKRLVLTGAMPSTPGERVLIFASQRKAKQATFSL
jgi:hypothetical protein